MNPRFGGEPMKDGRLGQRVVPPKGWLDKEGLYLNLGCGNDLLYSYENWDYERPVNIDEDLYSFSLVDLEEFPWPTETETVKRIIMFDSLEHLEPLPKVMDELHRSLIPGGIVEILVPHYLHEDAYLGSHKRLFSPRSFDPWIKNTGEGCGNDDKDWFNLLRMRINHIFPFAWHQRKWLGDEIIGWKPHNIYFALEKI